MVILVVTPKWANCSDLGIDLQSKPEMEIRQWCSYQKVGVSIAIFNYQTTRGWLKHITGIHRISQELSIWIMSLMAFKYLRCQNESPPPDIKDKRTSRSLPTKLVLDLFIRGSPRCHSNESHSKGMQGFRIYFPTYRSHTSHWIPHMIDLYSKLCSMGKSLYVTIFPLHPHSIPLFIPVYIPLC